VGRGKNFDVLYGRPLAVAYLEIRQKGWTYKKGLRNGVLKRWVQRQSSRGGYGLKPQKLSNFWNLN